MERVDETDISEMKDAMLQEFNYLTLEIKSKLIFGDFAEKFGEPLVIDGEENWYFRSPDKKILKLNISEDTVMFHYHDLSSVPKNAVIIEYTKK
ncbi:hypothetical protein GCK72_021451 [Caenorhabditis remanei]|uniref:DUF38 domain-containing protein n=1 Tax=Caenorhabditis remanei TaxID=31234 RepID=A0A6A5GJV8_CAERE|nr:hypothetical protein GCK72_021451 [Caenorhabditis remanei]KAF1754886.1 hypothetical protein GCK72_021451 [Caenorhabditis remanei]